MLNIRWDPARTDQGSVIHDSYATADQVQCPLDPSAPPRVNRGWREGAYMADSQTMRTHLRRAGLLYSSPQQ